MMNKVAGVVMGIVLICALGIISFACAYDSAHIKTTQPGIEIPYKKTVEDFIKNDATYRFDGIENSMKITNVIGSTTENSDPEIKAWTYTVEYQTRYPGHGDRTGQVLAQLITIHSVAVKVTGGQIEFAVCDNTWDMLKEEYTAQVVSGVVLSGGDTTPADGPQDAPRRFVYTVQQADGTNINVSYIAYPPSPAGDAARAKIALDFYAGMIQAGDYLEAGGAYDQATDTLTVEDQGDYIRTFAQKP